MKQYRNIRLIICFIYIISLMTTSVFAASVDQETVPLVPEIGSNSCHGIDAPTSMLGSNLGINDIASAFLYEAKSETLMYAMNADQQMYPSSLVKVLTGMIAVERGNPDEIITVKEDVLATLPYDAVSADLLPDEKISLKDLLYCMMVGSANDAAAVIADHICGSQEAFVQVMNEYAAKLGCTATNFTNAHGLHDEAQYTTARDMARILSAAVKNANFYEYYSAAHYTVAATNKSEKRHLSSNNFLINIDGMQIYYDPRVTGGRIGTAEDGTRCLAISAEKNDMQLICIVMGAESVYAEDGYTVTVFGGFKETSALLDAGFDGFKIVQVLFPNRAVKQQKVLNGDSDVVLGIKSAAYVVLPSSVSTDDLSYRYDEIQGLEAPVKAGDVLSKVQIWNGSICVAESDLFAMNSVSLLSQQTAIGDETEQNGILKTVLIVIAIVIVVAAVTILSIRYAAVIRHKVRQKRYRQARRRSR